MRIAAVAVGAALAAFFAACLAAGVFDEVVMSVGEQGPFCLVYREHTGPYREVTAVLLDVRRYLKDKRSVTSSKGFARFLDNPQKVSPQHLRSIAGCITDSLLPDVQLPYKTDIFPGTRAVTGAFPVRTFLSQLIGPLKFYPRLFRFLSQEKLQGDGSVMEIYDKAAKKIVYIAPVK
jgi:hypothetical protein